MTPDKTPSDAELLELNAGEVHFSESPTKYPEAGHGTQYHAGAPGVLSFARAILAKWGSPVVAGEPYGWHYWNNGGASVLHRGPSSRLDADIEASKQYPKVHHVVPLFTTPQPTQAQAGAVDDTALIQQLVAAIDDMRLAAAYTTYGAPNWDDLEPALAAARASLKDAP